MQSRSRRTHDHIGALATYLVRLLHPASPVSCDERVVRRWWRGRNQGWEQLPQSRGIDLARVCADSSYALSRSTGDAQIRRGCLCEQPPVVRSICGQGSPRGARSAWRRSRRFPVPWCACSGSCATSGQAMGERQAVIKLVAAVKGNRKCCWATASGLPCADNPPGRRSGKARLGRTSPAASPDMPRVSTLVSSNLRGRPTDGPQHRRLVFLRPPRYGRDGRARAVRAAGMVSACTYAAKPKDGLDGLLSTGQSRGSRPDTCRTMLSTYIRSPRTPAPTPNSQSRSQPLVGRWEGSVRGDGVPRRAGQQPASCWVAPGTPGGKGKPSGGRLVAPTRTPRRAWSRTMHIALTLTSRRGSVVVVTLLQQLPWPPFAEGGRLASQETGSEAGRGGLGGKARGRSSEELASKYGVPGLHVRCGVVVCSSVCE